MSPTNDTAAAACMEASDLPGNYLSATLEPQGIHKLADTGSEPMVSTKQFPPGNTLGTGLWECTPGSWHIKRTTGESFLVLKGKATIYEEDGTTVRAELRPGLWHTTPVGWTGQWVVTETVRKMFIVTEA